MKIRVKNFQSIEDATIDVDGFTVLVGPSNSGKTAMLRALRATCFNRFSAGQVRQGEDSALICLQTEKDAPLIYALRPDKGGVKYRWGTEVYDKVGRTVPSTIAGQLNLGMVDQYSLNFHAQFQPPLLHGFSQGKLMELLSASPSLDKLKDAQQALRARRTYLKGAVTEVHALYLKGKEDVSRLKSWVDDAEPYVRNVQAGVSNLETAYASLKNVGTLRGYVQEARPMRCKMEAYRKLIPLYTRLGQVKALQDCLTCRPDADRIRLLQSLVQKKIPSLAPLSTLRSYIEQKHGYVVRIQQIQNILDNHLCPLCNTPLHEH